MNIKILHGTEGAKEAIGATVIIDVFRAFTVEAYIMNNGANTIYPIGDASIAYDYKEKNNDYVLVGERGGKIMPGFDFGNSPTSLENIDFTGKTILHTTSNGTQGIANAKNAEEILTGSLVNAKATVKYIKEKKFENVSLVCMGAGLKEQEEDNLCAYYMNELLNGNEDVSIAKEIRRLKTTSGAKFFNKELNEIFPEKDFYLSTEVDKFNFVLKVEKDENEINYIRKIEL